MHIQYVSLNAVCTITGYKKGFIYSKLASLDFPQPVRRNHTLMFRLDQVLKWDKINRQKLIDKYDAVKVLHASLNEFDDLLAEDRFPAPALLSCGTPLWHLGDILNYRAKWRL